MVMKFSCAWSGTGQNWLQLNRIERLWVREKDQKPVYLGSKYCSSEIGNSCLFKVLSPCTRLGIPQLPNFSASVICFSWMIIVCRNLSFWMTDFITMQSLHTPFYISAHSKTREQWKIRNELQLLIYNWSYFFQTPLFSFWCENWNCTITRWFTPLSTIKLSIILFHVQHWDLFCNVVFLQ